MMIRLTLGEAQSRLPHWLERAARGEDVEINDKGKIYRVVTVMVEEMGKKTKRVAGLGGGGVFTMHEPFDQDLPDSFWMGEK